MSGFGQGQHQIMSADCQQPAAAMPSFCCKLASAAAAAALLVLSPSPAVAALQLPPVQAQPTANVMLAPRPSILDGSLSIAAPFMSQDNNLVLPSQQQPMQHRVQEMVPHGIASEVRRPAVLTQSLACVC
jgi:hypothetical protein